jgi:hypothetical protein
VKLTHEDRHSRVWAMVMEYVAEQTDLLRRKNDGMLDELTTANIRGRIAALKELAAQATVPPEVTDE